MWTEKERKTKKELRLRLLQEEIQSYRKILSNEINIRNKPLFQR